MSLDSRSTFLSERCRQVDCGGKVYRYLQRSTKPQDDNGGEVYSTQVFDCCDDCKLSVRESTSVPCPLTDLDLMFDRWDAAEISREEFDRLVITTIKRSGGHWLPKAG